MAKRQARHVNPHAPQDPYREKPTNTQTSVGGPNEYDQQFQRGYQGSFPHAGGAPSDGGSDNDEDYGNRRRPLPGKSISGTY